MPETRARDLANLAGAGATSSTVAYHETARGFTLPAGTGENNQVISSDGDGTTVWADVALTPEITGLTWYSDSGYSSTLTSAEAINLDDATYLKVAGKNFGSSSAFQTSAYVQIINTTQSNSVVGHNQNSLNGCVTAGSYISETEVRFTINPNGISGISAGDTLKVKFVTSGGESLFATGYVVSADPTSVTTVNSTTISNTASVGSFGGQVAGGGDDSNTKLLLNFDRGGGTDIEDSSNTGGYGHKVTAINNAVIKASPFGDGKTSINLEGNSRYLYSSTDARFDFRDSNGGIDFCLDFWLYRENTDKTILAFDEGLGSGRAFELSDVGGQLKFKGSTNGTNSSVGDQVVMTSGTAYGVANSWNHIAMTCKKDGTTLTFRFFCNGNHVSSFSSSSGNYLHDGNKRIVLGAGHAETGGDIYMDEVRFVAGETIFPQDGTNFTPSTVRYGSSGATHEATTASNVKFLLHSNLSSGGTSTFTTSSSHDSSGSASNITLSGSGSPTHTLDVSGIAPAMTWPASKKATGSAGIYFDGAGDYLSTTLDSAIGTSSFTLEFFIYPKSNAPDSESNLLVFDNRDSGVANGFTFYYSKATGNLNFGLHTTHTVSTSSALLNFDQWNHVALVRNASNNKISIYSDGTRALHDTDSNSGGFNCSSTDLIIGQYRGGNYEMYGYLDNIRLSYDAKYTDATLTVPTQIYGATKSNTIDTITLTGTAGTGGGYVTFNDATLSGNAETDSPLPSNLVLNEHYTNDANGQNNTATITGDLTGSAGNYSINLVARVTSDGTDANIDPNRKQAYSHTITKNSGGAPVLFNARRYIGTSANKEISGLGLAPDLVWIKERTETSGWHHQIFDSVRGSDGTNYYQIEPNRTNIQGSNANSLTVLTNDGFKLGVDAGEYVNKVDKKYIAWVWKAGGAPSGSLGTINSGNPSGAGTIADTGNATNITQSVSQTSGFSITKFTGNDSGVSIPHNLGATPNWIIIKNLTNAEFWSVWHSGMTNSAGHYLKLNDNIKETIGDANPYNIFPTAPSSTLVYGGGEDSNGGKSGSNFIMYAWKAVSDVSAFGTYEGTGGAWTSGNNGGAQDVGFKPKLLITKNIDSDSTHWMMFDSFREASDTKTTSLYPNLENEENSASDRSVTFDTNGFKFTSSTTHSGVNTSGDTYIYCAFA